MRRIARDALAIAVADAASGLSFGALAVSTGLSVPQACVLSLLAFTGASQFALIGVIAAGGVPLAGVGPALLLGARNALYALRLRPFLPPGGGGLAAAQLVVDESAGMAFVQPDPPTARRAFFFTGAAVFLLFNLGTLGGAVAGSHIGDPRRLGIDAAGPAVFLALLVPQVKGRRELSVAALAAAVTVALTDATPPGVPILVAAAAAVAVAVLR